MLLDFMSHLVSLDLAWIIQLILDNLLWLFLLYATLYVVNDGKKTILGTILLFFIIWAWMDFERAGEAIVFAGSFLGIYYITKIAFIGFFEKIPGLGPGAVIILSEIHYLTVFILFNVFMR